jgi:hypothetical protein
MALECSMHETLSLCLVYGKKIVEKLMLENNMKLGINFLPFSQWPNVNQIKLI